MNMIVSHTIVAYVTSKNKNKFVDFDVNSNVDFGFINVSLIGENVPLIGKRDSKGRMNILDKEIQFCFDSYIACNFYRVKSLDIGLCHGTSLK